MTNDKTYSPEEVAAMLEMPTEELIAHMKKEGLLDEDGFPTKKALDEGILTTDPTPEQLADMEKPLIAHGTPERFQKFSTLLVRLFNNQPQEEPDWKVIFQLLSEAALEWPGEETHHWSYIVGICAHCLRKGIESGQIDMSELEKTVGHA